jgi:hypothetical protein
MILRTATRGAGLAACKHNEVCESATGWSRAHRKYLRGQWLTEVRGALLVCEVRLLVTVPDGTNGQGRKGPRCRGDGAAVLEQVSANRGPPPCYQ